MSVQKLVSEAEKLLEKGKVPEGIAKLKQALQEEPLNQIIATKLANILVQNQEPREAVKVYVSLARNLSDAGKSHVAIAMYKQAIELAPEDIQLRIRFAQECESAGKSGDAFLQGQMALNHYLRRKKFFDACNIFPLLVRSQPKDEKLKIAWVEVMQLSQADQKLLHLLVALCGPPGLVSQEFQVGGEPAALSPALYEALKKLVLYFPRDPKVAYSLAWCAYRRGQMKEFYGFLHECLRREPDFSLGLLLFARVLSEEKKLNECFFVYQHFKERMALDKSVDMLTLNRLLDSFIEKNGWIKFTEESDDLLDARGFLKALTGKEKKQEEPLQENVSTVERDEVKSEEKNKAGLGARDEVKASSRGDLELPPAEIEIGLGAANPDAGMEILLTTGQTMSEASKQQPERKSEPVADPLKAQADFIKATIEAAVAGMGLQPQQNQQTTQQTVVQTTTLAGQPEDASGILQTQAKVSSPMGVPSDPSVPSSPPAVQGIPNLAKPTVEAKQLGEVPRVEKEPSDLKLEGFKGGTVEFTALIPSSGGAPDAQPVAPGPENIGAIQHGVQSAQNKQAERPASIEKTDSVELSSLIQADKSNAELSLPKLDAAPSVIEHSASVEPNSSQVPLQGESSASDLEKTIKTVTPASSEDQEPIVPARALFNPLEHSGNSGSEEQGSSLRMESKADERTKIFDPMEILDAAKVMQNREFEAVETRSVLVEQKELQAKKNPIDGNTENKKEEADGLTEAEKKKWLRVHVEGERTTPFSPLEAVQAASDSRRPMDSAIKVAEVAGVKSSGDVSPEGATVLTSLPLEEAMEVPAQSQIEITDQESEAPASEVSPPLSENFHELELSAEPESPAPSARSEGVAFMPIPSLATEVKKPATPTEDEKMDLGEDLLEGPTRIFSPTVTADKTEHLIKELKQELQKKVSATLSIEMLMKKAERYTAKRNYYLARKALRHAQALGADQEIIKERLREIRKLEFPEGLYNTISSDQVEPKVNTAEVLERLEQEFDLVGQLEEESDTLSSLVEQHSEKIFELSDPRTILDFGIALHEMGLFRQAESLFIRLVSEYPDCAFDAYYLAAISKLSRRDYAGAASILKKLSADAGKSDLEKIQIYYALGETFEKMRQTDRSKQFFRKVAELDSNYRNIRHKLDE